MQQDQISLHYGQERRKKKQSNNSKYSEMGAPSFPPVRTSSMVHRRPPTPYTNNPRYASSSCLTLSTEILSSDGEEVLNPLDEEALAALPDVLKDKMTDIQLSRIKKWQRKLQGTFERSDKHKRTHTGDDIFHGKVRPTRSNSTPLQNDCRCPRSKPGKARLRTSRSASILDHPKSPYQQPDYVPRPRTADATSTPQFRAEELLNKYYAAPGLRNQALFSNAPTVDERRDAADLTEEMNPGLKLIRFATPRRSYVGKGRTHGRQYGFRGWLKQCKRAIGVRKTRTRDLHSQRQGSEGALKSALKHSTETSSGQSLSHKGDARSYRAQLEGYDI